MVARSSFAAAAVLGIVTYPLLVYLLADHVHPLVLIGLLGSLGAARLATVRQLERKHRLLGLAGVAAFCLAAWAGSRFDLVKLYPVSISAVGAAYGIWTLAHPPSAAERFARAAAPNEHFDDRKSAYTRRVTQVWVAFFLFNGGIAAYTSFAVSTAVWAIYNGLVSYMLIGLLFGGEYLFRIWYRKRHYSDIPTVEP